MIIYIIGKTEGCPLDECKLRFGLTEAMLQSSGYYVANPFKLGCKDSWPIDQCMPFRLKALSQCDAVFLLPDFDSCSYAQQEFAEAQRLKLWVIRHSDFYEQSMIKDIVIGQ